MHTIAQALLMDDSLNRDPYFTSVVSLLSLDDWVGMIPTDLIPGVVWQNSLNRMAPRGSPLYGTQCAERGVQGSGGFLTTLTKAGGAQFAYTAEFSMNFSGFYTPIPDQNRFWDIYWSGDGYSLTVNQLTNKVWFVNGSYSQFETSFTVIPGTWHQFAIVFNLTNVLIFVDGQIVYTASNTTGFPGSSTAVSYSPGRCSRGNGDFYTGAIDECRLTVGVARYSANYTPPTRAFPRY